MIDNERGKIMKNLSISKKLIIGFGMILILMIVSIVISIGSINKIDQQVELYGQYTLPNNTSVWTIRRDIVSAQRYMARAFAERDAATIEKLMAQAAEDGKSARAELDKYSGNQRNADRDAKIKEINTLLDQTGAVRQQIAEIIKNPTEENIQKGHDLFLEQYVPTFDQVTDILLDFTDTASIRAEQQRVDARNSVDLAWLLLISCAVVSVLLTVVITILIRNSILKPVKEIVQVYEEMARGNMNVAIQYESLDELGQMAKLIQKANRMQATILGDVIEKFMRLSRGDLQIRVDMDYPGDFMMLKETIGNTVAALNDTMLAIDTAAEQVSTGASQVAGGAQALAAGSTQQAASVEELTVSIGLIADQAEDNSASVKTAARYVDEAVAGVNTGNEHMEQLTQAMADIGSTSNQITSITKVIEDIAFQTNILSLNAAIEAARAGSAGKGFAVVADEVRNLAAKSAEAARQTAELIKSSVVSVKNGIQTTEKTAQILQEVGAKAKMVDESIIKIEQASAEQAGAIEQIKLGLSQVSAVVQTNAATAQENSATSEEMSAQAVTLRDEVGKFKLNTGYEKEKQKARSLYVELPELKAPEHTSEYNFGKY